MQGFAVALGSFLALGTVAVLWENPLFVRMTPAGDLEIVFLGLLSVLLGIYVAIRRPFCSAKTAGVGGVLGFIGVACPVCNKILLLLFGGELLLTYFEPVRLYVAAVGVLAVAAATAREWVLIYRQPAEAVACAPKHDPQGQRCEGAP
jgi:hypothetical protein